MQTEINKQYTTEEFQVTKKHLKKYLKSLVIREMHIRTEMKFYLTLIRMAKIQSSSNNTCGDAVEKEEGFSTAGDYKL